MSNNNVEVSNAVAMMAFAAIVRTGSFSAAADWLKCSKAAVSRQIARLETDVGVRLLDRTTRSISLTPAGREVYERCARIVDEVNEANHVLSGMLSTPRGDLKINAPVVSSLFRLTQAFPRFLQKYPDVRVQLNLSDSKADLLHGNFDAAFWVGQPYDSTLEAVKLREYPMVLAGSPDYFSRRGTPTGPNELKEHDCIIETHLSRPQEWHLSNDLTVSVRAGPLSSNSVRMTREAIVEGMGIGLLPRFLLQDDIAAKKVVPILADQVSAVLPLYIMFPKGHYVLAKVKALVDFMIETIGEGSAA